MVSHNLKLQDMDIEHRKARRRTALKKEERDYISEMRANRSKKLRNETESEAWARILQQAHLI
jgi:hypothetical protein